MSSGSNNTLLLHQLCVLKLRHLKKVVACNIDPPNGFPEPLPPSCLPTILAHPTLQHGYFMTLHLSWKPDAAAFLISELRSSSCPVWNDLNILKTTPKHLHTSKGVVVRVWYKPPPEKNSQAQVESECPKAEEKNLDSPDNCSRLQATPSSGETKESSSSQNRISGNSRKSCAFVKDPPTRPTHEGHHSSNLCLSGSSPPNPPGCHNNTPSILLFSWAVRLSGLVPIGTCLSQVSPCLAKNTLVFQLMSGPTLYTAADAITSALPAEENMGLRHAWYSISLPMSQTKRSYTPNTLTKLHQHERDISAFERECEQRKRSLRYVGKLTSDSQHRHLTNQIHAIKSRLLVTRAVAQRERDKLAGLRSKIDDAETKNQEKGMQLLTQLQQLGRERQQLRTVCSQTEQQLQHLEKTKALLAHRRSSLIRDLSQVYPIVQISPKEDFSICDIWIPDATQYNDNNLRTPSFQAPSHRNKASKSSSSAKSSSLNSSKNKSTRESSPLLLNSDSKEQTDKLSRSQPTNATFYPGSSRSPSDSPKSIKKSNEVVCHSTTRSAQVYQPFHPNQNILNQSPVALPHTMESLSAGLGMSAHLLCLLSGLLQMPLRYPISPAGSLATITDVASTVLVESSRKFPLYSRGSRDKERDRLQFNYAVFLLNRNIGELLHYMGRPKVTSPAATLPNLYNALMLLTRKEDPLTKSLPDMKCQPLLNTNNPGLLSDILSPFLPPGPHTSLSVPKSSSGISLGQCQEPKLSSNSRSPSHSRSNSQSLSQSPQRIVSKSLSPSVSHRGINVIIEPSGLFSDINSNDEKKSGALVHSASVGNLVNVCIPSPELSSSTGPQSMKPTVDNDSLDSRTFDLRTPNSLDSRVGISSQITLSLDKGLDHIKSVVHEVRERGMLPDGITAPVDTEFGQGCAEAKLTTNTGSLTNLTKNKTLMVVSNSIDFEDHTSSGYEDETHNLLKSWHEDNPSQFSYTSGGSIDLLEEVGVEATENFMQSSSTPKPEAVARNNQNIVPEVEFRKTTTSENLKVSKPQPQEPEVYPDSRVSKRPINRNEQKGKSTKTKSRSFWPFSRSNTGEESSKDNSSVSEPLLAGDEDDQAESQKANDLICTRDNRRNSALANAKEDVNLLGSSAEENAPLLARENEASDELLKQSLAAMSNEIPMNTNLDSLRDLTQVADRTAKLASKPFTFKLSGK